jgi:peptidoglycan/LPS O-acetylase OafA/YrhL
MAGGFDRRSPCRALDISGTLAAMNAQPAAASVPPLATPASEPMVGVLRALLLGEAALGLGVAVVLSLVAAALRDALGGDVGRATEESIRFGAGGAFLFAIGAAIASRGARRRRSWAWTLAAVLQLVLAIGTGIAIMVATWHPAYLVGFGLAAVVMVVLSTAGVRRALGQS